MGVAPTIIVNPKSPIPATPAPVVTSPPAETRSSTPHIYHPGDQVRALFGNAADTNRWYNARVDKILEIKCISSCTKTGTEGTASSFTMRPILCCSK